MKVKSESEVAQSCPTLSNPMDFSLPGSSVHGIFQARVLKWGAIAFSVRTTLVLYYLENVQIRLPFLKNFKGQLLIFHKNDSLSETEMQNIYGCYSVGGFGDSRAKGWLE